MAYGGNDTRIWRYLFGAGRGIINRVDFVRVLPVETPSEFLGWVQPAGMINRSPAVKDVIEQLLMFG